MSCLRYCRQEIVSIDWRPVSGSKAMALDALGVREMSQGVKDTDAHVPKHEVKLAQL
jgi:hypothetical protein